MHVTYSENILINVSLEKYEKNHVINKIERFSCLICFKSGLLNWQIHIEYK